MINRTRIKICGITVKQEADEIVSIGVDALGLIFVPDSPRNIDPERAREIVKSLPPFIDAVGVFVNEDADVVEEIVQYCGLTMVQLHGEETPGYCEQMSRRVMKSFRVSTDTEPDELRTYEGVVSGYLLDTYHEKFAGGTGESFDWRLVEKISPPGPVILAGGLTSENVGQAINEVRPFAVDFNSGVEAEPGRKDTKKVRLAVEAVRRADRAFPD